MTRHKFAFAKILRNDQTNGNKFELYMNEFDCQQCLKTFQLVEVGNVARTCQLVKI